MSRTRVAGAAFTLFLCLLFAWLGWPSSAPIPESVEAKTPSPYETERARRARAPEEKPPEAVPTVARSDAPAVAAPFEEVLHVEVKLTEPSVLDTEVAIYAIFSPAQWFPTTDEAPFPESEASDLLQQWLDARVSEEPDRELRAAFVAAAEAEGLLDGMPDDPWLGLVAVQAQVEAEKATWLDEMYAYTKAEEASMDGGPPPGPLPRVDHGAVVEAAEALSNDEAVGDFARLYHLAVLGDVNSSEHDPDQMQSRVLEMMRESDDPLVLDAAVNHLSDTDVSDFTVADRRLLARIYDTGGDGLVREALSRVGLRAALAQRDLPAAERWLERVVRSNLDDCQFDCEILARDVEVARGRVAAMGGPSPDGWRAQLILAVWQCADEVGDPMQTIEGDGHASGWTHWNERTPLTRCIEETQPAPGPGDGALVKLKVVSRR